MLLYLYAPDMTVDVGNNIKVEFHNPNLRIIHNGILTSTRTAHIGEGYYVQPRGKKPPVLNRTFLTRGQKASALLSIEAANSYKEYIRKADILTKKYGKSNLCSVCFEQRYGFVLLTNATVRNKKSQKLKPLLAWVSDDITPDELHELAIVYGLQLHLNGMEWPAADQFAKL